MAQGHAGGGGHSEEATPQAGAALRRHARRLPHILPWAGAHFAGGGPCTPWPSWRRRDGIARVNCGSYAGYVGGHGYSTGYRGGTWGGGWHGGGSAAGAVAPGAAVTGMAGFGRARFTARGSPGSCPFCRWRTPRTGMAAFLITTPTMSITPRIRPMTAMLQPIRRRWLIPAVQLTRGTAAERRGRPESIPALLPVRSRSPVRSWSRRAIPGQIFMYPKNGQSTEQQATDGPNARSGLRNRPDRSHRMDLTTTARWWPVWKDEDTARASRRWLAEMKKPRSVRGFFYPMPNVCF